MLLFLSSTITTAHERSAQSVGRDMVTIVVTYLSHDGHMLSEALVMALPCSIYAFLNLPIKVSPLRVDLSNSLDVILYESMAWRPFKRLAAMASALTQRHFDLLQHTREHFWGIKLSLARQHGMR